VLAGGDEPGELIGYGPIPAPLTRALAADAQWSRWSADPTTGHVTGTGGTGPSDTSDTSDRGAAQDSRDFRGADGQDERRRPDRSTRRRYRPSAAVADLVRARDHRCRFPTCRRPAQLCDLDHVTPYPGGPTHPCNLASECRLHHLLKHRGGFTLQITPDGTTTWTTPTGHQHTDHPPSWGRPPPVASAQTTSDRRSPDERPPF
jgi:hypothetical protein